MQIIIYNDLSLSVCPSPYICLFLISLSIYIYAIINQSQSINLSLYFYQSPILPPFCPCFFIHPLNVFLLCVSSLPPHPNLFPYYLSPPPLSLCCSFFMSLPSLSLLPNCLSKYKLVCFGPSSLSSTNLSHSYKFSFAYDLSSVSLLIRRNLI